MVDFCISAVRYNETREHITVVRVHERTTHERRPDGTTWSIGPARAVSRAFIADLIRLNKVSFETIVKLDSGKWQRGAHVHCVGKGYLSTERNHSTSDNLSDLPEF